MKKVNIILLVVTVYIVGSCSDDAFLTRTNPGSIPEEKIYSDPALMELAVNEMYLNLPGFMFHGGRMYSNIADVSRSYWGGGPLDVVEGQWGPDYNPMEYWPYNAIRQANMFLSNVDESAAEEELKKSLKGQVKFIRAFQYFKMIKRYGGVPVLAEPQSLDDELLVERQSADSSFAFVVNELGEAINLLPETHGDQATDISRANKRSAKALLGRVMLFWASPLYNPGEDMSRWEKAATINKEIIDSGAYELHSDFRRIMLDKNNNEEIFSIQYQKPQRQHGWDSMNMPDSRSKENAVSHSPIHEFAQAFEMKNGKRIDDPGSGYDPSDPWENRDPRFHATLILNGEEYRGDPVNMSVNSPTKDRILSPYATLTGYLLEKGMDESNTDFYGNTGSDQNWTELRFAEVLLNFAEAKNEASGSPDQTVYNAVERGRERAGLDPYQLPAGLTKEQMRERIRHERYVELAFENKRYWDLRRWKTAVERLDGKMFHALHLTEQEDGSYTRELEPIIQGPYVFEEHMYFMPIPRDEIEKNPNLEQNPGW